MVVGSRERKIRLASATSGEMGRRPGEPTTKLLEDEGLIVWVESLSAIGGKRRRFNIVQLQCVLFIYKRGLGDGIGGSHILIRIM